MKKEVQKRKKKEVKKTEKSQQINWYIDFAFYRNLVNLSKIEKVNLDKEVYKNFFRPNERVMVGKTSENSFTGWEPVKQDSPYEDQMLIQLAQKTKYFIEKEVITLVNNDEWPKNILIKQITADNGIITSETYNQFSGLLLPVCVASNTGGSWNSSTTIFSLDPILVAQIVIINLLEESPKICFHKCNDPCCNKWFFNPRIKEQYYCSKKCLWRHKTKMISDIDKNEYLRKQRFWMKLKSLIGKNLSEEEFNSFWLDYLKKPTHELTTEEIAEWVAWGKENIKENLRW